jgi:hypothetical protein
MTAMQTTALEGPGHRRKWTGPTRWSACAPRAPAVGLVAFSGGADSAFVAWVATDVLGPGSCTAPRRCRRRSPTPRSTTAAALAAGWGLTWSKVVTDELDDPAYRRNEGDRCYWCKTPSLAPFVPWPKPRVPRSCWA